MLRSTVVVALLLLAASAARAQDAGWDSGPRWQARWDRGARFRDRHRHNLHLRVAGDYTLPQDATADGPVVVVGGNTVIDGHVEDDVIQLGGNLRVGPTAVVDGDVFTAGGNAIIDPAAHISGDVSRAHFTWPSQFRWPSLAFPWPRPGGWWSQWFAFGATVFRLCLVLFGGLLLTMAAPGWMQTISHRVADMPGVSLVIGLATEMFVGPALAVIAIALVISIVGIPLLVGIPILLALLACVCVAGFAATASRIGASIRGHQADWLGPRPGDFLIGFLALTAVTMAGRAMAIGPGWLASFGGAVASVGLFIEYCAWTIGLGAAIGALFEGHPQTSRPAIPPLPRTT